MDFCSVFFSRKSSLREGSGVNKCTITIIIYLHSQLAAHTRMLRRACSTISNRVLIDMNTSDIRCHFASQLCQSQRINVTRGKKNDDKKLNGINTAIIHSRLNYFLCKHNSNYCHFLLEYLCTRSTSNNLYTRKTKLTISLEMKKNAAIARLKSETIKKKYECKF